jgi:hypothetical protein
MATYHDTGVSMSPQPSQGGRWAIFVPASCKNMTPGEAELPTPHTNKFSSGRRGAPQPPHPPGRPVGVDCVLGFGTQKK